MRTTLFLAAAVVILCTAAADAQPNPSDLLMCTAGRVGGIPHTYGGLWRVSPSGQVTTIALGKPIADLVMANDNVNAIAACPDGVKVLRPLSGAWVSTLQSTLQPAQSVAPLHTGDYLVGVANGRNRQHLFVMTEDGSSFRTLYVAPSSSPAYEWHTHAQDVRTGKAVDGSQTNGLVYIDLATGAAITASTRQANSFTQDPTDGTWIVASSGGLYRVSALGKTLATLRSFASGWYAPPIHDWRTGHIVTGTGGALLRLDRTGNVIASHPGAYIGAKSDFHARRHLVTRRLSPGLNRWGLQLDFPGEGGRAYQIGLSMTGFTPGVALGQRSIPLVPDALLALTVNGGLGGLFAGSAGRLDAGGRATATLNLGGLGASIGGLRLWAAAITFDRAAPNGIASITPPAVLVMD